MIFYHLTLVVKVYSQVTFRNPCPVWVITLLEAPLQRHEKANRRFPLVPPSPAADEDLALIVRPVL